MKRLAFGYLFSGMLFGFGIGLFAQAATDDPCAPYRDQLQKTCGVKIADDGTCWVKK